MRRAATISASRACRPASTNERSSVGHHTSLDVDALRWPPRGGHRGRARRRGDRLPPTSGLRRTGAAAGPTTGGPHRPSRPGATSESAGLRAPAPPSARGSTGSRSAMRSRASDIAVGDGSHGGRELAERGTATCVRRAVPRTPRDGRTDHVRRCSQASSSDRYTSSARRPIAPAIPPIAASAPRLIRPSIRRSYSSVSVNWSSGSDPGERDGLRDQIGHDALVEPHPDLRGRKHDRLVELRRGERRQDVGPRTDARPERRVFERTVEQVGAHRGDERGRRSSRRRSSRRSRPGRRRRAPPSPVSSTPRTGRSPRPSDRAAGRPRPARRSAHPIRRHPRPWRPR